jgi:hypothetical protein
MEKFDESTKTAISKPPKFAGTFDGRRNLVASGV